MFKRLGHNQSPGTTNVEVRLSNTPMRVRPKYLNHASSDLPYGQGVIPGQKCGSASGSSPKKVETFTCSPALSGEYLVLLTASGSTMAIAEINVFRRGKGQHTDDINGNVKGRDGVTRLPFICKLMFYIICRLLAFAP